MQLIMKPLISLVLLAVVAFTAESALASLELPASQVNALQQLYTQCGGSAWANRNGWYEREPRENRERTERNKSLDLSLPFYCL